MRFSPLSPMLMALAVCVATLPVAARAEMMIPRDTLNAYQKSLHAGVRHVLIYDKANAHPNARKALRASLARLAVRYGFRLDTSQAKGYVTASTLAGVDIVVFSNGEENVLAPDGSPTASEAAMENFLYSQGKAQLMIHGAAAFLPCPGVGTGGGGDSLSSATCSFMARAAVRQYFHHATNPRTPMRVYVDSVGAGEIPPYGSLGATGDLTPPPALLAHGIRNPETRNIFTGLPRAVDSLRDEYFEFTTSPRRVGAASRQIASLSKAYVEGAINVLLALDENSRDLGNARMGDHPIVWTRKMGNGLVAVNVMGHDSVPYIDRDSIVEKFNWRLMRYLARDFRGCQNPGYAEYNPEASVTWLTETDDPNPCKTPVSVRPSRRAERMGLDVRAGVIRLSGLEAGARVVVADVSGKRVAERGVMESGSAQGVVEIRGLKPGIYFVTVNATDRARRVNLF